jgi:hypothetical protein
MLDVYLQKIDLVPHSDERLATLLAILYWDRLLPPATAHDRCSKNRPNEKNRTSPILSVFVKFKKTVKFKKIRPKHTGDDGGIVKTGEDQNAADFTDKSAAFLKNRHGNFRANFVRNRTIFAENR